MEIPLAGRSWPGRSGRRRIWPPGKALARWARDGVNLTPVAIREGHAFADTVYGGKPTPVDHSNVPTAVFSEPEIGVVGLTEAQARDAVSRCLQNHFPSYEGDAFRPQYASFMKLLVDGMTDRVVGCHIIGPAAAELIQIVGIAVTMGATKTDFDATMAVHPTAAEELVTMREKAITYSRAAAE